MYAQTRSEEATRIMRALSAIPGSRNVNVTSRRFARVGPAESGEPYEDVRSRFSRDRDRAQITYELAVFTDHTPPCDPMPQ